MKSAAGAFWFGKQSVIVVFAILFLFAAAAVHAATKSTAAVGTAAKERLHRRLHRYEFRVQGLSCVVCLRHLASTLRAADGVEKTEVSIFKPYWAVVIYDAGKINPKQLAAIGQSEQAQFLEAQDVAIQQLPLLVIPKRLAAKTH